MPSPVASLPAILLVGITLGCFAGLRAVGFAVVYGVLGEANLAYGDGIILAVLVAVGVHSRSGSIPLTIATGLLVSAALVLATDLVVLRPLRGRGDLLSPIMATIGLALILRNIAERTQGVEERGFPPVFGSATSPVAGTSVDAPLAVTAIVLLLAGFTGALVLQRTDWGRAVRAIRLDALGARVTGIPVGRVVTVLYGLSGAIGGLAGMIVAAHVGDVSVADGFRFTLIAFAAAAFGGGRSIPWAIGGGLVLGMVTSFVQFAYGQVWTQAAYLVILVAVLIVRPRGLARVPAGERV